ncbi:hypothetical protein WJX81_007078 [Elliptochloris bilobata]|uniref:Uncharacterized protein n=1 Tax=Elliptochloris bilobata TaxID=381761 RepID=A0AAW1QK22_9CHLO
MATPIAIGADAPSGSVKSPFGAVEGTHSPSGSVESTHSERLAVCASSNQQSPEAGASLQRGPGDLVLGEESEYVLPCSVASKLYSHQVEGVRWLWKLHTSQSGGILGDDMGLGKTMQCAAFLAGLFHSRRIRRALVIAPKTLLAHWEAELAACGLARLVAEYYGGSARDRAGALQGVLRGRGVLLSTYGMVLHNANSLAGAGIEAAACSASSEPLWDILILDEGHKIKNPATQLAQRLRQIPVAMPIIISGTPIQNDLLELHALFDYVYPDLLGNRAAFRIHFERPITAGNDKHATAHARMLGASRAAELRARIAPVFLRREKKSVLPPADGPTTAADGRARPEAMGAKNDLVVWLRLQPDQQRIYEAFLGTEVVKAALNLTGSALAAITVLKKICDHPALLSERMAHEVGAAGKRLACKAKKRPDRLGGFIVSDSASSSGASDSGSEGDEATGKSNGAVPGFDWASGNVQELIHALVQQKGAAASCKTHFIQRLLARLVAEGHRTLLFSQSRIMLDVIGSSLAARGVPFLRIDGTIASAAERQARVQRFQTSDIPVFLLTSQVGGLGLTLTAADRVIIVDPAWNPSVDNQSVDRAYRIGQARDVVVYRLITCGTVEEKIYRKQVFKGGLSRTGTEEGVQFRYFSQLELRDLFRLDPVELEHSATQRQLHALHGGQRRASPALAAHLDALQRLPAVAGVSDHDLLFSEKSVGEAVPARAAAGGGLSAAPPSPAGTSAARRRMAAGWKGGGDISELLARQLTLGRPGGVGATHQPVGRSAHVSVQAPGDRAAVAVETMEAQLARASGSGSQDSSLPGSVPPAEVLAAPKAGAVNNVPHVWHMVVRQRVCRVAGKALQLRLWMRKRAEVLRLGAQVRAMKARLQALLAELGDAARLAALPDGGRQLKAKAKALNQERNALKLQMAKLQEH